MDHYNNSLQHDYGDDDDDDDDTASDYSSDDQVEAYGRRNLPRHRYPTVDEDGHRHDDDNNSDNDDDENQPWEASLKRRRRERASSTKASMNRNNSTLMPPMFVVGETQTTTTDDNLNKEDEKKKEENDVESSKPPPQVQPPAEEAAATTKSEHQQQEEQDDDNAERFAQLRKEREDTANQRFWDLLEKGRGNNKKRKPVLSEERADIDPDNGTRAAAEPNTAGAADGSATAADLGFGTTTNAGIDSRNTGMMDDGAYNPAATAAVGLGMGPTTAAALPFSFGQQQFPDAQKQQQRNNNRNSKIGTWEKHTKGIGMKLLSKMGYKGSGGLKSSTEKKKTKGGTTASSSGIAEPVKVKVRPHNLGLGYGNFKEATSSSSNKRKQEQQHNRRGEESQQQSMMTTTASSLVPSTADVLNQQAWKKQKYSAGAKRKKKQPARTFVPYTELLKQQQDTATNATTKIIDMRGPTTTTSTTQDDDSNGNLLAVPIAEELLHNIGMLLTTHESRMYSASNFFNSHRRQMESLQSDKILLEQQVQMRHERRDKLQKVLQILNDMEEYYLCQKPPTESLSTSVVVSTFQATLNDVMKQIEELWSTFSSQERLHLRFTEVLIPTLLGTVIQTQLENWTPLRPVDDRKDENDSESTSMDMTGKLISCILLVDYSTGSSISSSISRMDLGQIRKSILVQQLLPKLKRSFESPRWNPSMDQKEAGLRVVEMLMEIAQKLEDEGNESNRNDNDYDNTIFPSEDERRKTELSSLVREELIHDIVYQKLTKALQDWRPNYNHRTHADIVEAPLSLHQWILPWFQFLSPAIIPNLVADCKRKMKNMLSDLSKQTTKGDDATVVFGESCINALRPWRGIFKKSTIQGIVSSLVTPCLAGSSFPTTPSFSHTDALSALVIRMHNLEMLADMDFVSILEGELLPHWASNVYGFIIAEKNAGTSGAEIAKSAAERYIKYKDRLFAKSSHCLPKNNNNGESAVEEDSPLGTLLRNDDGVCRCLYVVVLMTRAAFKEDNDGLEKLRPSRKATNYRIVLSRRKAEAKRRATDDLLRMNSTGTAANGNGGSADMNGVEARIRLSHRHGIHGPTPTFREVVEEFARERGILFQPRMGNNSTKDGKQVFLFGKIPVYLESNVAFASRGAGEWQPMSLDAIAQLAST